MAPGLAVVRRLRPMMNPQRLLVPQHDLGPIHIVESRKWRRQDVGGVGYDAAPVAGAGP